MHLPLILVPAQMLFPATAFYFAFLLFGKGDPDVHIRIRITHYRIRTHTHTPKHNFTALTEKRKFVHTQKGTQSTHRATRLPNANLNGVLHIGFRMYETTTVFSIQYATQCVQCCIHLSRSLTQLSLLFFSYFLFRLFYATCVAVFFGCCFYCVGRTFLKNCSHFSTILSLTKCICACLALVCDLIAAVPSHKWKLCVCVFTTRELR